VNVDRDLVQRYLDELALRLHGPGKTPSVNRPAAAGL